MTFTKVQRIELLLEEIKQILGTIKEEENDQDTDRRAQDVIEISTTVATEASTTDSESDSGSSTSHSTDTDIQSTGDDSSSSQCSERDLPDLCVRCFNNWEGYIMSGQYDFPSCQFDQGRGRKKCRYCSSRRSECVKVPISIRKAVLHRQNELHQATLGGDLVQIQRKQNKFADAYFEAHGKVKARISSEERNRRRKRAEMRRAEERKRRVGNGSRK